MYARLPVSSFAKGRIVPVNEYRFTPFAASQSQEKLAWANEELDRLYGSDDMIEIQLGPSRPSVATYKAWLSKALESRPWQSKGKRLATRQSHDSLFVKLVDLKEFPYRKGKGTGTVSHVIN